MAVLQFPAAAHSPAELIKALLALPLQNSKARAAASVTTEILRDPCRAYWADGAAQGGAIESELRFRAMLPLLAGDRIERWTRLAQLAVRVEMKHWEDPEYAMHADTADEVLIDFADEVLIDFAGYTDTDDDRLETSRDNRDLWADLADNATAHALEENALAFSHAA
ncbi:hypothetical protein [Arthrobacter sp. 2MCAF14]|uniref:hypothetical protein n=1 Tax=Arthrobacter sp. 2MCAF14 TaxID=3232982 RepID=UPI003F911C61